MWILSGLTNPDCIYTVNCRCRFTSLLHVAFEDSTNVVWLLLVLMCDTICGHHYSYTYVQIVVFKKSEESFTQNMQLRSGLGKFTSALLCSEPVRLSFCSESMIFKTIAIFLLCFCFCFLFCFAFVLIMCFVNSSLFYHLLYWIIYFLQPGIGMDAINDSFYIECCIYKFLKRHIRGEPYYTDVLELMHEVR